MARIPQNRVLDKNDFPDQEEWISELLSPINDFFGIVVRALNKGLTLEENLNAQLHEIVFNTDGSVTNPFPIRFRSTTTSKPRIVLLGKIEEISGNPQTITNATTIDWTFAESQVRINNITGLDANKTYKALFISLVG